MEASFTGAVHMFIHNALGMGYPDLRTVFEIQGAHFICINSLISSQAAKAHPESFSHCLCPREHVGDHSLPRKRADSS